MCLIGIAYQHLPGTPLLLLANRDEYYARPARAIDRCEDAPHILGGRDGQAGGSWLAVSESGRVAAVTNVRTGSRTPGRRSRGELVQAWLQDSRPAAEFAGWLQAQRGEYAPFNLLFGCLNDLYCFHSPRALLSRLRPGVHVLSNGLPDAPWPKSERLRGWMSAMHSLPADEVMLDWLADRTPAPVEALPNTGVGLALEKFLSPVFIAGDDYGTRASTVLTLGSKGRGVLVERVFHAGRPQGSRRLSFAVQASARAC